jgi:hypothetical protein
MKMDWTIRSKFLSHYSMIPHRLTRESALSHELLFGITQIIPEHPPAVLILVTVRAEVFPVRAVGRVIPMIAVLVMDRQEMLVILIELPRAFRADQPVNLKRALPVSACRKSSPSETRRKGR